MGRINYMITANNKDFIDKMGQVKGEIQQTSNIASKFGGAIGAAFSTAALAGFAKQVVNVRGEIQALETSFKVLAGAKGGPLFEEIRRFAVETPLGMQELAKSAQTLLSFNIEAERVMPLLRQIGDISMGDAQKMQSLTLAFAQMSSTGKLMGQDLLQMINAGFNPLSVIAEQTGKSIGQLKKEMEAGAISAEMIADAFATAAGEGGKFHGMLEQQSKGIKGMISNLEGAVEDMLNSIGEQSEGVIAGALNVATNLVQNYEKVGKVLMDVIVAYGAYKAAVIALSVAENIRYQAALAQMAGMTKMQVVMDVLRKKTEALNVVMAKNPYVLAGIAVAGLAVGIYKLVTAKTAEEKAHERVNKQLDEWNQLLAETKTKGEEATKATEEFIEAQMKAKMEAAETNYVIAQSQYEAALNSGARGGEGIMAAQKNVEATKAEYEDYKKAYEDFMAEKKAAEEQAAAAEAKREAERRARERAQKAEERAQKAEERARVYETISERTEALAQEISETEFELKPEGIQKDFDAIEREFAAGKKRLEKDFEELRALYEEVGAEVPASVEQLYSTRLDLLGQQRRKAYGDVAARNIDFNPEVDESELIAEENAEHAALMRRLELQSMYVRDYGSLEARRAEIMAYYSSEIKFASSEEEKQLLKAQRAAELYNLEVEGSNQKRGLDAFNDRKEAIRDYYRELLKLAKTEAEYNALLAEQFNALQEIEIEQAQTIVGYVDDVAGSLTSLGEALGSDTLSNAGSVLGELSNAVGNVMSGFASGGAVGAVVAAVGAVINLATAAMERYYERMQESAQLISDEIEMYDNYFAEVIEGATSAREAIANYNEALAENNRLQRESRQILRSEGYSAFANMSGDDIEKWIRENLSRYNALPEFVKTHLQNIIDATDVADDLTQQIQEKMTSISFDSVKDGMRDAILDGTRSVTDDVQEMMRTAIVNAISNSFSEEWNEWYDNFYTAMTDGMLSKEEAAMLEEQAQGIYDAQKAQIDAALGVAGLETDSRSASSKAVTQASQDSIDYMNGQLTLGNHTLLSIDTHLLDASSTLTKLLQGNSAMVTHLSNISQNTNSLPTMAEEIARMRAAIDSINTHGLRMKA